MNDEILRRELRRIAIEDQHRYRRKPEDVPKEQVKE